MTIQLVPVEDNVYKAVGDFLSVAVAPAQVAVAQVNRVPEFSVPDFVMMNLVGQKRLSTNVDDCSDALFTGSIDGNTLTITDVFFGSISVGSPVLGVDVAANTYVTALASGTGGVGTYTVNTAQTVASETIACGVVTKLQSMEVSLQLDVHGPASFNNATIISTLFRDGYGVDAIQKAGYDVTPLYCDDPRQIPFVNENQQVEQRWVITAALQVNALVIVAQEFASTLALSIVSVDAVYPPGPAPAPGPDVGPVEVGSGNIFGPVRYDVAQQLSPNQQTLAQSNIGLDTNGGGDVRYDISQSLDPGQQATAQANIGMDPGSVGTLLTSWFTAWFDTLPTTLPSEPGQFWNNGGTLAQS